MKKKKSKIEWNKVNIMKVVLVILSILVLLMVSYMYAAKEFHMYVLNQQRDEVVVIPKSKIMDCCNYMDEGEIKICRAIAPHTCDVCEKFCKS